MATSTGAEVVSCKYDEGYAFSEGLALVVVDGAYGFVDGTGKEVVPCTYAYAYGFSGGLALVARGDENAAWKYGFVDRTGP